MPSRTHARTSAKAARLQESQIAPPNDTELTLRRCDLVGLAECPASVAGPILHNFVRWFCGMSAAPLAEPLARAIVTQMRERHNDRLTRYNEQHEAFLRAERDAMARAAARRRLGVDGEEGEP